MMKKLFQRLREVECSPTVVDPKVQYPLGHAYPLVTHECHFRRLLRQVLE